MDVLVASLMIPKQTKQNKKTNKTNNRKKSTVTSEQASDYLINDRALKAMTPSKRSEISKVVLTRFN